MLLSSYCLFYVAICSYSISKCGSLEDVCVCMYACMQTYNYNNVQSDYVCI